MIERGRSRRHVEDCSKDCSKTRNMPGKSVRSLPTKPGVSNAGHAGTKPSRGIEPLEGRKPNTPHCRAGILALPVAKIDEI